MGDIVSLSNWNLSRTYSEVYIVEAHPHGLAVHFVKGVSGNWKCELVKRHNEVETGYVCEGIEMVEKFLTTVEMLKELTENPEKVFGATGISGKPVYVRIAEHHQGANQEVLLKATGSSEDSIRLNHITLNYKWTEVIEKEYTFEEAFDECKKNGTKFYREYRHSPNDEMSRFDGEVVISFNEELQGIWLTNKKWKMEGN